MIPVCACAAAAAATSTATKAATESGRGLETGDIIAIFAVIVSVLGLAVTIGVAAYNVVQQQKENRRQERAKVYAEALRAVEDYLEAPYRVRRRDGSASARWALTEAVSEIQSRINFYKGWLQINAPKAVYDAYIAFDSTGRIEAGGQMTAAWNGPVTKKDRQVPLGEGLKQPQSEAAREAVLKAMKSCLGP